MNLLYQIHAFTPTHENSMSLHDAKMAPPVITARLRSTSGVATCLCQKKSPVTIIRFVKLLNTVTCKNSRTIRVT